MKAYLLMLKTHVVNLKSDVKDLSCDLQRLEVHGKLVKNGLQRTQAGLLQQRLRRALAGECNALQTRTDTERSPKPCHSRLHGPKYHADSAKLQ